jgi:protoporphyrin/coproporphyrin ferrochelatase
VTVIEPGAPRTASDRPALLVMAHGTPAAPAEIEAFYTRIRRGSPPTSEQLADLVARYDAIGGLSPLLERTQAQVSEISRSLPGWPVALGQKMAAPFIEDAVASLATQGADRVIGLVLAPHWSAMSVGEYHRRASDATHLAGLEYRPIESWHVLDAYVELLASAVQAALVSLPVPTRVIFTAHSLPTRILDTGDPYPDQLRATAVAVAERCNLVEGRDWRLAWQSAGRTPEPWLGPDILEVIREEAASFQVAAVLVCACGFVADHLEVLFDLDVEAAGIARGVGMTFARTPSLGADPSVMAALAELVRDAGRVAPEAPGAAGAPGAPAVPVPPVDSRAGRARR